MNQREQGQEVTLGGCWLAEAGLHPLHQQREGLKYQGPLAEQASAAGVAWTFLLWASWTQKLLSAGLLTQGLARVTPSWASPGDFNISLILKVKALVTVLKHIHVFQCQGPAPVDPGWFEGGIQGDSKVGTESASLEKYMFNYRSIERLEMDSVVGKLVEKKMLNNLVYVE